MVSSGRISYSPKESVMHQFTYSTIAPSILLIAISFAGDCSAVQYISSDTYTRYELLSPESHQFKIYYEVTETRPGAKFHFNAIREGSDASDESVIDLATGKSLKFEVVTGAKAAEASGDRSDRQAERFNPASKYI